jgi:hypothetical protein
MGVEKKLFLIPNTAKQNINKDFLNQSVINLEIRKIIIKQ